MLLRLALATCCVIALGGCTGRQTPVSVTNAAAGTNPQLDLAAAVLRDGGMQAPEVKRGQAVVMGTASCEAGRTCFSCFQCHGVRGEGGAAAALPRLAGQDQRYLHRALQEFASGQRQSATMREVAEALTEQQKQDVATYYAKATAPAPLMPPTQDEASAQTGLAIEEHGVPDKGVPPCATCHSAPPTQTQGPIYPYIKGQFADYLAQQLDYFSAGTRQGADASIMQTIARGLTPEQVRAVSVHFAAKPPPPSAAKQQ